MVLRGVDGKFMKPGSGLTPPNHEQKVLQLIIIEDASCQIICE